VKRITAHYRGKVQGVGFRYTTCRLAEQFRVSGQVRNLCDGSVEMIAEGEPAELDRFLAAIEQAMAGYIDECNVTDSPVTNSFDGFGVAY
jgi:acylphosphatase